MKLDHDFRNAKVGDKAYTAFNTEVTIIDVSCDNNYAITIEYRDGNQKSFTIDGKYFDIDECASLFKHPVKIVHADALIIEEREMMVKDVTDQKAEKRVVFLEKNGQYIAWADVETIERAKNVVGCKVWRHAESLESYHIKQNDEKQKAVHAQLKELEEKIKQLKKELEELKN